MSNPILETLTMTITKNKGTPSESKEERTYDIPQGTVTEADLEEAEGTKADAIVRNASGDIASYDDGGDLPMKSLKVNIVPKQSGSGDPSPNNVRPISGTDEVKIVRSAGNLWDEEWELGTLNSSGAKADSNSSIRTKNYIPILPNATYYFKCPINTGRTCFYDANKNHLNNDVSFGANSTFTTPSGAYYMMFVLAGDYGTTYNNNISVNYPPTDTEYHKGATPAVISVTLPTTVYGGTLDVVSGKLVIDWIKKIFVGASGEGWRAYPGEATWVYSYGGLYTDYPDHNVLDTSIKVANILKSVDNLTASTPAASFAFTNANSYKNVYVKLPSDIADVDAWKTYLASNNLEMAYKVYAPTEIDLTPTEVKSLLGDNNVWSDSGTVEVEYRADTSLVINKILEALEG